MATLKDEFGEQDHNITPTTNNTFIASEGMQSDTKPEFGIDLSEESCNVEDSFLEILNATFMKYKSNSDDDNDIDLSNDTQGSDEVKEWISSETITQTPKTVRNTKTVSPCINDKSNTPCDIKIIDVLEDKVSTKMSPEYTIGDDSRSSGECLSFPTSNESSQTPSIPDDHMILRTKIGSVNIHNHYSLSFSGIGLKKVTPKMTGDDIMELIVSLVCRIRYIMCVINESKMNELKNGIVLQKRNIQKEVQWLADQISVIKQKILIAKKQYEILQEQMIRNTKIIDDQNEDILWLKLAIH